LAVHVDFSHPKNSRQHFPLQDIANRLLRIIFGRILDDGLR
jgi:hypothetical protein